MTQALPDSTQDVEDALPVEEQYTVRLSMPVTASDPVDAVNEFINQILLNGLDSYLYAVTDEDGDTFVANTSAATPAEDALSDLDDDEIDDEDVITERVDSSWDVPVTQEEHEADVAETFHKDGECVRCKDKGKISDSEMCQSCAEDLGDF